MIDEDEKPCDEMDPLRVMAMPPVLSPLDADSPEGDFTPEDELEASDDVPPLFPDAEGNEAGCVGIEDIVFDCVMLSLRGRSSL